MEIELSVIKFKRNLLQVQHGRELAKESKTKCGQNADELYESSWSLWGKCTLANKYERQPKVPQPGNFQPKKSKMTMRKKRANKKMNFC
mmetsp:Transcript_6227/g.9476  ORF Transcript_6227/g.9476 Transcript_6227/m.9476 type:complete len:89 (-) Transcript_6227:334-600(-)|eukprot:CAMPEP_0118694512 /NCGR_PEP_ID=MMETSP0800-20121206/12567_1 /TAXON_ID=210618 ORGANISM="Striatella unipunctata, Strain CCMP2910" /NCGR_SAMPLE_ID=MMETSP0800 /ASSEMBLY_ACC=CAM_ASM_000638 /LENGTH=88 /DNA_ID=CAMNT_0006592991 /DNA_START=496 /DNA_END=762 /DNA_ORIENTATION=+